MKDELAIAGGRRTVPERLKARWPVITDEDRSAVMSVLDSGILWGMNAPQAAELQRDFARYVGARHCIAVNSGTAALHMTVAAAGAGPGDEVITSAFTFLASAAAVLHSNAIPVFADIKPDTFNIDPAKIEEKITSRTKAIMPVHIHGLPCDMDEILSIARKHNLAVIEEAAQAHGSTYRGKKAGVLGDMAMFSLHAHKNLPAGEGGLFVTNSDTYHDRANMVRVFGERCSTKRDYLAYTLGWNYRMPEMSAALARSQLVRLDRYNEGAGRNGKYLSEQLHDIQGVTPQHIPGDRTTNYHQYRVKFSPAQSGIDVDGKVFRDAVKSALEAEGVDVCLWQTIPLPAQPIFVIGEGYGKGCPWNCRHAEGEYSYNVRDYPETAELLDNSILVCTGPHPMYVQPLELMKYYAEAFHKVFDNIDRVMDCA